MTDELYLIALGSNMRHARFGAPRQVVARALEHIELAGAEVVAASPVNRSRPIGPSQREFANAAAIIRHGPKPRETLAMLQDVETRLGRRRLGQKWRARVIDLDIVLWGGGVYDEAGLQIPHPRYRARDFVLLPASVIAPGWRDPIAGLSIAQINARLTRPRALPIGALRRRR